MRILYVTKLVAGCLPDLFTYHGEWTDTFELALAVKAAAPEHRITILTPRVRPEHRERFYDEFGSLLESLDIEHVQAPVSYTKDIAPALFRLKMLRSEIREARRMKAEIVQYGQFGVSWMYPLKRFLKKKIVAYGCYVTADAWEGKEEDRSGVSKGPARRALNITFAAAHRVLRMKAMDPRLDRIVLMHQQGFDDLRRDLNGDQRVRYIPKGCTSRGRYVQRSQLRNVFYLGLLQFRKGVRDFIVVAEKTPELEFHIFGPPGSPGVAQVIDEAAERLPNLKYRGNVGYHEKWRALDECDLLLLPSYRDAFPSVIMESMSCGIPVITTDAIDSRVRDGENGYVIPAGDVDAMVCKLESLRDAPDHFSALSAQALSTYQENTWGKSAEDFLMMYHELLS
jgi:glycosyltransferase involved in cell wall biosynthesis